DQPTRAGVECVDLSVAELSEARARDGGGLAALQRFGARYLPLPAPIERGPEGACPRSAGEGERRGHEQGGEEPSHRSPLGVAPISLIRRSHIGNGEASTSALHQCAY